MRTAILGFLLLATAFAQQPRSVDEVRASTVTLQQRIREINALWGVRPRPAAGVIFTSGGAVPAITVPSLCTRCDSLGVPQTLADWETYERLLQETLAETIENAPLCSGTHASIDRGIRSVDRQARWAVENHTRPEDAAADARALESGVADYASRVAALLKELPQIKAARERVGSPMPAVCDGSEREFNAALDDVRRNIAVLRERAGQ